jgi:hypothetical protein
MPISASRVCIISKQPTIDEDERACASLPVPPPSHRIDSDRLTLSDDSRFIHRGASIAASNAQVAVQRRCPPPSRQHVEPFVAAQSQFQLRRAAARGRQPTTRRRPPLALRPAQTLATLHRPRAVARAAPRCPSTLHSAGESIESTTGARRHPGIDSSLREHRPDSHAMERPYRACRRAAGQERIAR